MNHDGKAILLFAAGKLFYNLLLHPLRKYPGPFFAGSTRAYYLFYDVRGLSHWKVNEWHQKYGPVIRIAPDELSCTYKPASQSARAMSHNRTIASCQHHPLRYGH